MPTALPLPVTPSVLQWARLESGYAPERVAKALQVKQERVMEWEQGLRPPTLRQVENLADLYHRPLSLFFQPSPPAILPLAAEYRRLPGVVPGNESPELRLALRQMSGRRERMLELLGELGQETPAFTLVAHLAESPATVAGRLREALAVPVAIQWGWANEWQAWASWRSAVEQLGVLVFQFSKVPLEETRGVSLLHWPMPVAAVNGKEAPEPRSFTLIHEIIHLMLAAGHEESPAARESRSNTEWSEVERFAEETASHVLIPQAALEQTISQGKISPEDWGIPEVRSLSRRFRVTPLAMATRLRAAGYFSWDDYQQWKREWEVYVATLRPRKGGFAHPVSLTLGRAGRPFTRVVLEALAANRITAVHASRYLDLKFEHFDKLKDALRSRPGTGGENE